MKPRFILSLLCAGCASLTWATLAEKQTYQAIIDAKPFGDMAESAETDTVQLAEEQKQKEELAQKFRMCGITDMPDGSRKIAFLDETSGEMASYLLGIGETQNGFTLVDADYDRECATLTKDGLTFTLALGMGLVDTPQPAANNAEEEPLPMLGAAPPNRQAPPRVAAQRERKDGSFRKRLLARRAAKAETEASEKEALQERVKAMEAEKVSAERRTQIERIKQGLAPTQPIQLTPEEDAELEAAGVFRADTTPENAASPEALP